MKTIAKKSAFGFAAVNAGQRNVAVEPQLVALSTLGGFRLTGPATKLLGIAPGDYVGFFSNVDKIDEALSWCTKSINDVPAEMKDAVETTIAFANEQGLELGSAELAIAAHKEFDQWAICKGYALYNSKGTPLTVKERLSLKDKEAIVKANFDEILASAMASDNAELVEALSREGISYEEQAELLMSVVEGREVPKYKGSKSANPSGMTGVGLNLNFTDSNVWNQLKVGVEEPTKINRVFDLLVDDAETLLVDNGYEDAKVTIIPLGDYTDKAPATRGGAEADEE